MAEGRRRDEWQRFSLLAAVIANANPYRKRDWKPNDFDPFGRSGGSINVSPEVNTKTFGALLGIDMTEEPVKVPI